MLFDIKTVPTRKELLLDLAAFGATVIVAVVQGWRAADIVWASWIASLAIGLVFFLILATKKLRDYSVGGEGADEDDTPEPVDSRPGCLCLAVGVLMALVAWIVGPGPVRYALLLLIGLDVLALFVSMLAPKGWLGLSLERPVVRTFFFLPSALFLFFFFLVHFGVFHLGHAFALSFFVPPEIGFAESLEPAVVTFEIPVDTSLALDEMVEELEFNEAWASFRASLVDARAAFFGFLALLILTYWPYIMSVAMKNFWVYREALLSKSKRGEEMILPYKNVIRVHILIFALVPLAAFGSSLAVTLGVVAFYFFPIEAVVAWVRSR